MDLGRSRTADSISQALTLIGIKGLWDKVGAALSIPASDARTRLNIIVDRRNRIAHESDIDPTMGLGTKYPIDYPMMHEAVEFLNSVVHVIHATVIAEAAL